MLFEVELNLLSIDSIQELDGWAFGVLSRTSPVHILLGKEANESDVNRVKFHLFSTDFLHPQIPPAALLDFVNLREGEAKAVVKFLQQYGLLKLWDLKPKNLPKRVRSYCDDL